MQGSDKTRRLSKVVFFFKQGGSLKICITLVSSTPGAKEMQSAVIVCCQKALIMMDLMSMVIKAVVTKYCPTVCES